MDSDEMRSAGRTMVDYVADFWDRLPSLPVLPAVKPGYLQNELPSAAPMEPEPLADVLKDVDQYIIPGMTHWHHPHFFAYFPTACSYPAVLADMLSDALACIGFSWAASPACTELEIVMMNWLGRLLNLPDRFIHHSGSSGGGVIQGTASEATIVTMLAARSRALADGATGATAAAAAAASELEATEGGGGDAAASACASAEGKPTIDRLVCYTSEQAHSSVERAALICHVTLRKLPTDSMQSLRGDTLREAIESDRRAGLIPFYVCASVGTTSSCAYDNLIEIGHICQAEGVWMHVDAAYAGAACICPEYRHLLDGVEYADSFNFNPHKWMMVTFDCSALWIKDCKMVADAFNVDPLYLKHANQDLMIDFRHLQLPLGRRFRSLKLWFVFRLFGVAALQDNIRKHVSLAHEFEQLVIADSRFEIFGKVTLGLVCFRLKASNALNEELNRLINTVDRRIHLVPSKIGQTYFLRLAICSTKTNSEDVKFAWAVIQELTAQLKFE